MTKQQLQGDDYIEASVRARWILFVYSVLLLAIVFWFQEFTKDIMALLESDDTDPDKAVSQVRLLIDYLLLLTLLHAVVLSVFMIKTGVETIARGLFPPMGSWVLARTKILGGDAARKYGLMCYFLAFLVCLPVAIPWYLMSLLEEVIR